MSKAKKPRSYKGTKPRRKKKDVPEPKESTLEDLANRAVQDYKAGKEVALSEWVEQKYPGISVCPSAKREAYMRIIQSLRIQRIPVYQISKMLGVNVSTVISYTKILGKQYETEMGRFSLLEHAGRSIDTYRELQGAAARLANSEKVKHTPRIMALGVAIDAENRINALLKEMNVFKAVQFTPVLSNASRNSDGNNLSRAMAQAAMSGNLNLLGAIMENAEEPEDNIQSDADLTDADFTLL